MDDELEAFLDEHPELFDLIEDDLVRHGRRATALLAAAAERLREQLRQIRGE